MGSDARRSTDRSGTILVVDDDDNVREVMRCILLESGYTVLQAASGSEALRISQEHRGRIDLLLTDVVMPGMDGPELAQSFASLRADTKVLYVSGYRADDLASTEVLGGSGQLLVKPFSCDDLTGHVRAALGGPGAGRSREEPREVLEPRSQTGTLLN
jgi:two-component system cell cycle sensor histidine kinase/response regulator CckA